MSRPRGTGSLFQYKGCAIWYLKYYRNGIAVRESSGTDNKTKAGKILQARLAELAAGTYIEPANRRITVDELYAALLDDYRNNELPSLENAERRWQRPHEEGEEMPPPGRLTRHFSGVQAAAVTTDRLNKYVAWCREQGLSNASVNRDMSALRRAFKLALRAGKIQKCPNFPHLKESAPRSGFVEEATYSKLTRHARELWMRALLATAYTFSFRKGELLNLRVGQVDLLARTIRLNAGETKSGAGRLIKMTQDVYTLLQACVTGKTADDYVFTRQDGKRVKDFRESWYNLCVAAGLGHRVCRDCGCIGVPSKRCPNKECRSRRVDYDGLLFHDLRRSGVRNMIRRGIPEVVAMKISGHKTRSVFDRYNIVSEADLADAALKIEAGKAVRAEVGQNFTEMHHNRAFAQQQEVAASTTN